mmetsp:Transcript_19505/g.26973  ORF Transcript_19505/g.26973 Transcript_19505/m.26973 type:complete len:207 (+) Transcript_19505:1185-1805(+)
MPPSSRPGMPGKWPPGIKCAPVPCGIMCCCCCCGAGPRIGLCMPISLAAVAWTSSMVMASSFLVRGTHLLSLRSMTSLHINLILEGMLSFLVKLFRRWKYPSTKALDRGAKSKFLPTVVSKLQSASTFSSGGTSRGFPRRSVMQAWRIFSMIIFSLNNSPMSRMFPRVFSFTNRSLNSFSSGVKLPPSAISCMAAARWAVAPSNSS